MTERMTEPKRRTALHLALGKAWFSLGRRLLWLTRRDFAKERREEDLPCVQFRHETPLLRQLQGLEMELQYNKITNLHLAAARIDGLLLRPGETFSYWRCIGAPTARRGYLPGMVLRNGKVEAATGGGLCQLSNLIYWMTLHTPLTVTERHHHGYDVFPDANRTQPFGSGATCFYPYGDLMIRNDTDRPFQLRVWVGETHLHGEWRAAEPPRERYEIVEKGHRMQGEYWGGFTRHNELWRRVLDENGGLLREEYVTENHVHMLYEPFLPADAPAE